MIKSAKFYIYNFDNEPLCWELDGEDNERAIEFETRQEAENFLTMVKLYYPKVYKEVMGIEEVILYYDEGYIPGMLALELMKENLKKERGLDF